MSRRPITSPPRRVPVALTVAGSDSGGGAGIQADLKTLAAYRVFGTSAVTCVTAQNPRRVAGILSVGPDMLSRQIRAVCEAFAVRAAKTGMLYSAPMIRAAADALREARIPRLVVDPVMVATSGACLLREDAVGALTKRLLPLASVVTPNLPEAEILAGRPIRDVETAGESAMAIEREFGCACLVKGGHLAGNRVVDVLAWDGRLFVFAGRRVPRAETHGTGCTLSAALTACLALGYALPGAVAEAKRFVESALRRAVRAGGRHRPLNLFAAGR